jgi:hypothetical protein
MILFIAPLLLSPFAERLECATHVSTPAEDNSLGQEFRLFNFPQRMRCHQRFGKSYLLSGELTSEARLFVDYAVTSAAILLLKDRVYAL